MVKQEPTKKAYRVGAIACAIAQTYMAIVLIEYSSLALQRIRASANFYNISLRLVLYREHHGILRSTVWAKLYIIASGYKIFWSAKSVLRTEDFQPVDIDALHRQNGKMAGVKAPAFNQSTLYLCILSDQIKRWFVPAEASRV